MSAISFYTFTDNFHREPVLNALQMVATHYRLYRHKIFSLDIFFPSNSVTGRECCVFENRTSSVGKMPTAAGRREPHRHSPLHQSGGRTRPAPREITLCGKTTRQTGTASVRVLCGNMMHLVVLVSVTVRFIYVFLRET